jgi:Acyl-CoA dehydrogenase, C-terminal domain
MDLSLTPDHLAILDALDSLAKPYVSVPIGDHNFALTSEAFDLALAEGGFLEVGRDPDLGALTATLVAERLARLPFSTEAAMSLLVGPLLNGEETAPLCVVEEDRLRRPVRFLRPGATVLVVGDTVSWFVPKADLVRSESNALFGYPVATLLELPNWRQTLTISPEDIRTRWRIALAAEAAGLLAAALESVSAHTSDRQQFGRPLATFQALRHRLAEAQVRTNGVYWLAMKAAATLDAGDAALAALHAQETARVVVYDYHQFLGAMGMTLEHPLHLWTYRLKALASELGGRGANALAAAEAIWGD